MKSSRPEIPKWIIEKNKEWNELKSSPQPRLTTDSGRMHILVRGFDTETLDGYCRLIACSDGSYIYLNNFDQNNLDQILSFLSKPEYSETLNFFYNIDFDAAAILKYLPVKNLKQLYSLSKTRYKEWTISYVPRKAFTIRKGKSSCKYFDLWQYYRKSLENAVQAYISKDLQKDPIDREKLGTDWKYWQKNLPSIISYCIKDARLTQELGDIMQEKLNALGLSFDSPFSTGTISIRYFSQFYDFPRFKPTEWNRYAYLSYFGGRFEVTQKGYFDNIVVQDIASAYPYQIANLIDINKGEWFKITDLDETADIAFYRVVIDKTTDHSIQPLGFRQNGLVFYPEMQNILHYLTQDELLLALDNYDDIEITVIDGWAFYASEPVYPFEKMREIFEERKKIKESDPILQLVLKIIMNSKYGKAAEKVRKYVKTDFSKADDFVYVDDYIPVRTTLQPGRIFNPVYASLITSRTRVMLVEQALKNPDHVVAMFTDSIFSTKKIVRESSELGGWEVECEGEALIIGSGVYTVRNKNTGLLKTRLRGIHLDYDNIDLFEVAEANKNKTAVELEWKKTIKPKEALLFKNKYSIKNINHMIHYKRELNVRMDKKRKWLKNPVTFSELLARNYESLPLHIP